MKKSINVNADKLEHLRNVLESADALLYSVNKSLPELINAYQFRYLNDDDRQPLNQRTIKYLPQLCQSNRELIREVLASVRWLLRQHN